MSVCYSCKKENSIEKIYRSTECPFCGKELHVCLNCRFYKPGAQWDCAETVPELVKEKDRANFCGYFEVGGNGLESGSSDQKKKNARDAFDNLFG